MKQKPRFNSVTAMLSLTGMLLAAPLSSALAEVSLHYNILVSSQMNAAEFGRLQMEIVNHGTETLSAATATIDDPDGMRASFSEGALALGDLVPGEIKIVEADFTSPPLTSLADNPFTLKLDYTDASGNASSSFVEAMVPAAH